MYTGVVLCDLTDTVGTIGGTILCIELIGLVLVLVAINAGLIFGLRWVLGKADWTRGKIDWATGLVNKYVDKGANIAAAPVIVTSSVWSGLKAGLYRATHWPKSRTLALSQTVAVTPARPLPKAPDGGPSRAA